MADKVNVSAEVKALFEKHRTASNPEIFDMLQAKYPKVKFKKSSFGVACAKMKTELGIAKGKGKGKSKKAAKPTASRAATAASDSETVDMKTAVAFAIKSFGSIETAIAQLDALVGINPLAYVRALQEYQSVAAIAQPDIKALAKEIVTDLKALGVKKAQINAAKIRADHKWNVGSIDDAELSEIVAEVFSA